MHAAADAEVLARLLEKKEICIVFAESCTAGMVSSTLARVPGISRWHCGSAVSYRDHTKQQWLGITEDDIKRFTAVSEPVARQMAIGVLSITDEADYAASITGHLGPDAPSGMDGTVYVSIAQRKDAAIESIGVWRFDLTEKNRVKRQEEATALVLERLTKVLS